jgi:elongation factor Ts
MIKQLREKTGAGMMDCKRALEAVNGDINAAIEHLRKKGAAVSQKRADRSAKEGVIITQVNAEGTRGVIVEINCETDFVGKSDDFVGFGKAVAEVISQHTPSSVDEILGLTTQKGKKVSDLMNDLLSKVSEKVEIRRFNVLDTKDGRISAYTHLGNKIGVLIELAGSSDSVQAGRDAAMQIAAMNPLVINRNEVDKATVDRELEIYRTQAKNEGKPEQVVEKIASGKLEKYYQEVVLLEQTFIKDSGKTMKEYLTESSASAPLQVRRFTRFHLGEETK